MQPDREFEMTFMKKLNKRQENSELRNEVNEQKIYFPKEIETLKKNQTEILDLKESVSDMKNTYIRKD